MDAYIFLAKIFAGVAMFAAGCAFGMIGKLILDMEWTQDRHREDRE